MIYLDYAATTPMKREAVETYLEVANQSFGNASSLHAYGRRAKKVLNDARRTISRAIHATPETMTFTSGGTEADNLAIFGAVQANAHRGRHLITTTIEHQAVLQPFQQLERRGFDVTYVDVDEHGVLHVETLEAALRDDTIFVSVMYGNNEVGALQPIQKIGALLRERNITFHTDAVQAFGVVPIDVERDNIDLLSISAHKIGGPQGVGALYVRESSDLQAHQVGGNQERRRRGGTENVAGIAAFARAVQLVDSLAYERMLHYQKQMCDIWDAAGVQYALNSDANARLPHIMNVYFPHIIVDHVLARLDMEGIALSSGSACTAGATEPSHVLRAMYGETERAVASIRISFGEETTVEEVQTAANVIGRVVLPFQQKEEGTI